MHSRITFYGYAKIGQVNGGGAALTESASTTASTTAGYTFTFTVSGVAQ